MAKKKATKKAAGKTAVDEAIAKVEKATGIKVTPPNSKKKKAKKTRRSAKQTKLKDEGRDKAADQKEKDASEMVFDIVKDLIDVKEESKEEFIEGIRERGRPTKYRKDVHPLCLELLMSQGLSFEASCAQIGIHADTGQEWAKKYEEFSVSKKRGEQLSLLWWERNGKKGMFWGKDFNATVWVFAMKNRHNWRDNKDLNVGGQAGNPLGVGGPLGLIMDELQGLDDDQLKERLRQLEEREKQSGPNSK